MSRASLGVALVEQCHIPIWFGQWLKNNVTRYSRLPIFERCHMPFLTSYWPDNVTCHSGLIRIGLTMSHANLDCPVIEEQCHMVFWTYHFRTTSDAILDLLLVEQCHMPLVISHWSKKRSHAMLDFSLVEQGYMPFLTSHWSNKVTCKSGLSSG